MVFFIAGELSLGNGRVGFDEFVKVADDVLNFWLSSKSRPSKAMQDGVKMTKKRPKNAYQAYITKNWFFVFLNLQSAVSKNLHKQLSGIALQE